jgi:hypothetical protein
VRRLLLLAALLCLAVPSAAQARPFKVGTGQNAGIAIDDGGTIYVAWQINVYNPGDAVQFCIIPPRATRCGFQTTVAFPGQSFNRARASVLLQGNNVIDVVEPRTDGTGAYSFLARSIDGGRTFGPARRISAEQFPEAIVGPGGSIGLVGAPTTLRAGLFNPDGTSANTQGSELGPYLEGVFNDIASNGNDVLAAGSDANVTHAFRLPLGANDNDPGSWQQIDPARAREPKVAGLPGGFAIMLEPSSGAAPLFVQRLEGAGWSPPVGIAPSVPNSGYELVSNGRGRLTAVIIQGAYHFHYTTSTDGGVLWSSLVNTANFKRYQSSLQIATNSAGAGAAVGDSSLDDKAIRVSRFTPRAAPVKRRTIRGRRVQVRGWCDDGKLSVLVEAARGTRRVSPGSVLRRASFGRTRRARPGFRTRFRARYTLRRRHATVPVRLVPRRAKARTVRLRVRRCSATS